MENSWNTDLTWNSQSINRWITHSNNSNTVISNFKINLNRCHFWEKLLKSLVLFNQEIVFWINGEETEVGLKWHREWLNGKEESRGGCENEMLTHRPGYDLRGMCDTRGGGAELDAATSTVGSWDFYTVRYEIDGWMRYGYFFFFGFQIWLLFLVYDLNCLIFN